MTPGDAVVIADDHAPTRAGVTTALERGGFRVVAAVGSALAAVQAALEHRPVACVLDIEMPGDGILAARAIHEELPDTAIVMLTVAMDDERLFQALRAGALGYLLKDTDPNRLAVALRGVMAGEAAIPRSLVARLVQEFAETEQRRPAVLRRRGVQLSEREAQVLDRLREGLSTKAMAADLQLSEITVRRHVSRLLAKLDVPDRESAIALLRSPERGTGAA